jgi:hypothetical protein
MKIKPRIKVWEYELAHAGFLPETDTGVFVREDKECFEDFAAATALRWP